MDKDREGEFLEALEAQVERFGLISQIIVNQDVVDSNLSKEEILETTYEILEKDEIPKTEEERLSYFNSGLRIMMEEGFDEGIKILSGVLEASMGSLGNEILEYEDIDRYESVLKMIAEFSKEQLNLAFTYVQEFRETDQGIALAQKHVELGKQVDSVDEIDIKNPESARKAIDGYSKSIEVCDNATIQLLAMKRIDDGGNPLKVNLTDMGFSARMNELLDSECRPLVSGIDKDIRNAISHGDLIVNPYSEEVYDADTGRSWDYDNFESATKTVVSVAKFMASLGMIITVAWLEYEGYLINS